MLWSERELPLSSSGQVALAEPLPQKVALHLHNTPRLSKEQFPARFGDMNSRFEPLSCGRLEKNVLQRLTEAMERTPKSRAIFLEEPLFISLVRVFHV